MSMTHRSSFVSFDLAMPTTFLGSWNAYYMALHRALRWSYFVGQFEGRIKVYSVVSNVELDLVIMLSGLRSGRVGVAMERHLALAGDTLSELSRGGAGQANVAVPGKVFVAAASAVLDRAAGLSGLRSLRSLRLTIRHGVPPSDEWGRDSL